MDYENIFKQAAVIAWKHKILWLFGILAGCGANGASSNLNFNQTFSGFIDPSSGEVTSEMERFFYQFPQMLEQNAGALMGWAIGLFCLGLILQLVFFILRNYGFAGITNATANIELKGLESINFQTVSKLGSPYVLRLLGLNLLLALPGLILFIIFMATIVGTAIGADGNADTIVPVIILTMCCLACIGFFIMLAIQMIGTLAKTALVVDDLTIMDAFRQGWTVLKENFGSYFILWLMLFVISILINMVMVIPGLIVAAPTMGMLVTQGPEVFMENIQRNLGMIIGLSILMWPFIALLRGIITTFTTNIWTLAYLDVTAEAPASFLPPAQPIAPLAEGE